MELANKQIESYGDAFSKVIDLTANIQRRRYWLLEYSVNDGSRSREKRFVVRAPSISLLVTRGKVRIEVPGNQGSSHIVVGAGEGAHLFRGCVFTLSAIDLPSSFLIASGEFPQFVDTSREDASEARAPLALSSYSVQKPWGFERWYTQNISEGLPYALKLISMLQGKQSSLQSHREKSETNYVVEGTADLLHGAQAPADVSSSIDLSSLKRTKYGVGQGWSNPVGEIHRVIATEAYKAVEVSTPELDDVIRWQDDSNGAHGRIESEHGGQT